MLAHAAGPPSPGVFEGIFTGLMGIQMGGDDVPSGRKPSLAIPEGALGYRNPELLSSSPGSDHHCGCPCVWAEPLSFM